MDVAIEFSTPAAARENIRTACAIGVPTVVGTTGWYEQLARARAVVDRAAVGLVWSPNYSIGVNVFRKLVAEAAALLAKNPSMAHGHGKFITPRRRTRLRGTLLQLVEEMQRAGYTRAVRRELESRRRESRDARNWI